MRNAPELTPVFSVGTPMADGSALLLTVNDRDFTRTVRRERSSLHRRGPGVLDEQLVSYEFVAAADP